MSKVYTVVRPTSAIRLLSALLASFGTAFLLIFATPQLSHAHALKCENIFSENSETPDLSALGQAMTRGMLLHPKHGDIFEVYRKVYFGDPSTGVDGRTLKSVTDILQKNPDLEKPHFREYNIDAIEKVYGSPDDLTKWVSNQIKSAGQVRANLFQIEANVGFWKKLLNYQEPESPKNLSKEEQKAFRQKSQSSFIEFLDKIINAEDRKLLADAKANYQAKIMTLFQTLKQIRISELQQKNDISLVTEAMVNLIHIAGYGNPVTIELLKSSSGLDKLEGLKKVFDERDILAKNLGYAAGFRDLEAQLGVNYPSVLGEERDWTQYISSFESSILAETYTVKKLDTIRVRSLSIQEAPFRSCLGGPDCSTRTYFDKALDPNFNYFTMTEPDGNSTGQVTVVLGVAKDPISKKEIPVAFVDKVQNVPNHLMKSFFQAISLSVGEKGYKLVIPEDVGFHNGISNIDSTRYYINQEIIPKLKQQLVEFTVLEHKYKFENGKSRAYEKLSVKLWAPLTEEKDIRIEPGASYSPYMAEEDLDQQKLVDNFINLKNSSNESDLLKFVNSSTVVQQMKNVNGYSIEEFQKDLETIAADPERGPKIKRAALVNLAILKKQLPDLQELPAAERKAIFSEVKQWARSSNEERRIAYDAITAKLQVELFSGDIARIQNILQDPLLDINLMPTSGPYALRSVLMTATGKPALLEFLLSVPGIDVNLRDYRGRTALMIASENLSLESVKILLHTPGIDMNGALAYVGAATVLKKPAIKEQIIRLLLAHRKVDVNESDSEGNTILMSVAKDSRDDGDDALFFFLLEHPSINIHAVNSHGETALSFAVRKRPEQVKHLLKASGIKVNFLDDYRNSPLGNAIGAGQSEVVQILLEHGHADVNQRIGNDRVTPVMFALAKGQWAIAEKLLEVPGIQLDIISARGETALSLATKNNQTQLIEKIQQGL